MITTRCSFGVILLPILLLGSSAALGAACGGGGGETLEGLCEPSGMAIDKAGVAWVVDNEVSGVVFRYTAQDMSPADPFAISLGKGARDLTDLEGISIDRDGKRFAAVASHSRKKYRKRRTKRKKSKRFACPTDEDRNGLVLATLGPNGLTKRELLRLRPDWLIDAKACVHHAFVDPDDGATSKASKSKSGVSPRAFCKAVTKAEGLAADAVSKNKNRKDAALCANSLNIEAAVWVKGRLWLGLRAPVIQDFAWLLRVAEPDGGTLRFDAVARVGLGGAGIRSLSRQSAALNIIAGPAADGGRFSLWRVAMSGLKPGATLNARRVRPVPASSEGMARGNGKVRVVIDGDGEYPETCDIPGRWQELEP